MFIITFEQIIVLVFSCTHFAQFVLLSLARFDILWKSSSVLFVLCVRVLNEIQ